MSIKAIKLAVGIECANCSTCAYRGTESDGGDPPYAVTWPVCNKFPHYEHLKSFPFKKEMTCWVPEFWVSKFAKEIRTADTEEVNEIFDRFRAAVDAAKFEVPA